MDLKYNNSINMNQATILILGNVYNMIFLVVLLAYGLFYLPLFLWKYADNQYQLYTTLETAHDVRRAYRDAQIDFYMIVNQCRNLAEHHRTD